MIVLSYKQLLFGPNKQRVLISAGRGLENTAKLIRWRGEEAGGRCRWSE